MVDNSEYNLFQVDRELNTQDTNILYKPVLSDIRDKLNSEKIFNEFKPQIVFHAAAYKHVPLQENFPNEAIKTNIYGTTNIAQLSLQSGVEKFVLVSTDKAVRPTNVMGATKKISRNDCSKFRKEK